MGKPVAEVVPTDLGRRLSTLREASGVGVRELGRLSGIAPAVFYQLERGLIEKPNAEIALRLAEVFGATPHYLVRGEGDPPTPAEMAAAIERAKDAYQATGTEG